MAPRRRRAAAALALLATLCHGARPAAAQSLNVATVGELRSALTGSAEHILITDHLNFSSDADSSIVRAQAGTRSIRGECTTPLPLTQGPIVTVEGRCVIDVPGPFLQADGAELLLSNLHVRLVRTPDTSQAVTLVTLAGQNLWILNSHFDGNGAGFNTRGFEVSPDRKVYMRDATITGFNSSSPGTEGGAGVMLRPRARARFRATNFVSNTAPLRRGVAIFLQSGSPTTSTAAWVSGGRFTEVTGAQRAEQRSKVFIALGGPFAAYYMDYTAAALVWTPEVDAAQDPRTEDAARDVGGFLTEGQLRQIVDSQAALLGIDPIPLQEGTEDQGGGGGGGGDDSITAVIIGSVVAAVVAIAAVGMVALLALRHKRRAAKAPSTRTMSATLSRPRDGLVKLAQGTSVDNTSPVAASMCTDWRTLRTVGRCPAATRPLPRQGGAHALKRSDGARSNYQVNVTALGATLHKADTAQGSPGSLRTDSRFTGLHTASADATWDTTVAPPTIAGQEPQDRLVRAIMNLATSQPQVLFAGAYLLTTDVVYGAQGIVVFARGRDAGMRQYAIKFFLSVADFEKETACYLQDVFRACLPGLQQATLNADQAIVSRTGFPFPPFMVLDRGVTLSQWLEDSRSPSAVLTMASEVLELLAKLHASGTVHRDIKPANLIFVLHSLRWRLLDFGIVAPVGKRVRVACTLRYAPPEAIKAHYAGQELTVQPSLDIWAIGVLIYEGLTGQPTFPRYCEAKEIAACARGEAPYPWEKAADELPAAWRKARMRPTVAACLAHDPAQRPSALQLLRNLRRLDHLTTLSDA